MSTSASSPASNMSTNPCGCGCGCGGCGYSCCGTGAHSAVSRTPKLGPFETCTAITRCVSVRLGVLFTVKFLSLF